MESSGEPTQPEIDAASAIGAIDSAQRELAASLVIPPGFYASIGAAIAIQIATLAVGVHNDDRLWLSLAGGLVFIVVAGVQIRRFQRQNGTRIASLVSRVVLGTSTLVSVIYVAALVGATWAAFVEAWWLVAVASIAGGLGYAVTGRRWVRAYQRDPAVLGQPKPGWFTWLEVLAGVLLLVVLLVNR